jgi:hypothetical protein
VLVACEYSGRVRDAFIRLGHDAVSCDLLPSERPGPHITGDVLPLLREPWDLVVAFPPCTYLANSGVRWLYGGHGTDRDPVRWALMEEGAAFFRACLDANAPRVAVENPVQHGHAGLPRPTQTVQPWMFGHPERKATCLWLRGLPPLVPTDDVRARMVGLAKSQTDRVHYASPGPDRWKERSRTYQGIADAMADRWGAL